jgi:hypothetical protein
MGDKPYRESVGNPPRWQTFARTINTTYQSLKDLLSEDEQAKYLAASLMVEFYLESGQVVRLKSLGAADADYVALDAAGGTSKPGIRLLDCLNQIMVASPSGTETLRFAVFLG